MWYPGFSLKGITNTEHKEAEQGWGGQALGDFAGACPC